MKKNLINEDIHKMMGLIGYNRGKTLTENKEHSTPEQLNEIFPALVKIGTLGYGLYKAWEWGVDAWGSKNVSAQITSALDQKTWPKIDQAIRTTEKKTGKDIEKEFDMISANEANQMALELNKAFDSTFGTDEDVIGDVFANLGSFMDLARLSYVYGERVDGDLAYELDDELSQSDFKTYVGNNMKRKPLAVFNGKSYSTLESLLVDIAKEGESEEEGPTNVAVKEAFKRYPCVVVEIDNAVKVTHPYKGNDDQVFITNENGDIMLVNTSGKYVAKVGGEKSSGTIECPDDFTLDSETDLTLSESYIFEQSFGGVKLNPTKVKDSSGAEAQKDGGETKPRRVEVTYNDITDCKGEVKKGDRGQTVKEIQTNLNRSSKVNPKLKVDGIFGAKTEAAIKQAGGDRVFNCDVAKLLNSEKPEPSVAGEEVTKQEENELDKVTIEKEKVEPETLKDQIADLEQAISQQPTKEACKTLIATAAAGLKKGVKLNNTSSLKQCYNSYNFGFGKGSMKVKKSYGIKGKGN